VSGIAGQHPAGTRCFPKEAFPAHSAGELPNPVGSSKGRRDGLAAARVLHERRLEIVAEAAQLCQIGHQHHDVEPGVAGRPQHEPVGPAVEDEGMLVLDLGPFEVRVVAGSLVLRHVVPARAGQPAHARVAAVGADDEAGSQVARLPVHGDADPADASSILEQLRDLRSHVDVGAGVLCRLHEDRVEHMAANAHDRAGILGLARPFAHPAEPVLAAVHAIDERRAGLAQPLGQAQPVEERDAVRLEHMGRDRVAGELRLLDHRNVEPAAGEQSGQG
jgi:hypothetical protein